MRAADIFLQHRKMHLVTDRVKGAINLAMEKVVNHDKSPQQYPLPSDPKSLERALHNLFSKLPNKKQKKMIEKASVNMKKSAAQRRQIYGDLMAVNLKSSVPIVDQVKALPPPADFKLTQKEASDLIDKVKSVAVKPKLPESRVKRPRAVVNASELKFFIDSLTCIKKDEISKDEINLAGVSFDNVGGSLTLAPFFVGKFTKGDTKAVGQNPFSFKIDGLQFPGTFSAGLFIIEKDLLHNPDTVNALILAFAAATVTLSAITLAMIAVGLAGGPFSVALIVAGLISIMATSTIQIIVLPLLADDISDITFDSLTLDRALPPGITFDRTIPIEGVSLGLSDSFGGKYQAAVHWVTQ